MNFINLSSTASTLLVTLYSRANFSKKGKIIHDPKAEEIIQQVGYNQKRLKLKRSHQAFLAIRAKLIDDYVQRFINTNPTGCTIIQAACGLDSRYLRLKNTQAVKWYDLDLYGTISLRKNYYKETKNYKMIESNVCNFTWIEKIDPQDLKKPTLIIAEGLFMYLSKEDNEKFFSSIPLYFKNTDIIFDVFSPFVVTFSKWTPSLKRTNAYFKFGFNDLTTIEKFSTKIHHKKTLSYNKNDYVKEPSLYYQIRAKFIGLFFEKSRRLEIYHID